MIRRDFRRIAYLVHVPIMFVAEVYFPTSTETNLDEAADRITSLLAVWFRNGQIATPDWTVARTAESFIAHVEVLEADSLENRHANVYVTRHLKALGVGQPTIRILGSDPHYESACSCTKLRSLVLFTHYLTRTSPVRCGECFLPVPLYHIAFTADAEHYNLLQWAQDYRACDTLQMHCTTGERFAEAQLARLDSALNRQGREIAKLISEKMNVRVYYNLFKARGLSHKKELERMCPSCGNPWLLAEPWHKVFDFRCDTCYLVSNVACSLRR